MKLRKLSTLTRVVLLVLTIIASILMTVGPVIAQTNISTDDDSIIIDSGYASQSKTVASSLPQVFGIVVLLAMLIIATIVAAGSGNGIIAILVTLVVGVFGLIGMVILQGLLGSVG